jgi:1,4-alpha-glucan branching enzyme
MAWIARAAELNALARGRRPGDRALRELLALQSSDWAFLASRELAGDYPRERARGHAEALARALDPAGHGGPAPAEGIDGEPAIEAALRNLAPELVGWMG